MSFKHFVAAAGTLVTEVSALTCLAGSPARPSSPVESISSNMSAASTFQSRVSALKSVTKEELNVLQNYTENEFASMNDLARRGVLTSEIQMLDGALEKLGNPEAFSFAGDSVYRGLDIPAACFPHKPSADFQSCPEWARRYTGIGDTKSLYVSQELRAYTSTAWDASKAFNMYNVTIKYKNTCLKGVDLLAVRESWGGELGKSIPILDSAEGESEVLFPRNMKELITKMTFTHKNDGVTPMVQIEARLAC